MTKDQTPSREEVIRWAREAGFKSPDLYKLTVGHASIETLERLAQAAYAAGAYSSRNRQDTMSNTPNLKPCPFCGGMATAKPIDSVPGWYHVTVLHSDCFYKPEHDQMLLNDEHLAAWNRRTPQQEAQEPVALLVRKNSWRAGQWEVAPPGSPSYGLGWADQRKYVYAAPQPTPAPLSRDQIREVFMTHGFTIKEGQTDLKQYVYDAAYALLELVAAPPAEQQAAPKAATVKACVCGEPQAPGTVHRVDGPCYVAEPQQAAPKAAPARRTGTIAHIGNGRTTLTAAIASVLAAPQREAQEPVALLVRKNSWRAGQWEAAPPDSPSYGLAWANQRQYVYAAPQPAPAPLSDDTERLEWLLWKLPGDALRYVVGELADTSSGSEFRAAIDAAIAAQGDK